MLSMYPDDVETSRGMWCLVSGVGLAPLPSLAQRAVALLRFLSVYPLFLPSDF